jgi:toxin-antitoxin system PIN domain toxin
VIVLDANLLLYAYDSASTQHELARRWVEATFSGVEPVGLPWQTISAFLRIATNPRLPGNRFTMEDAAAIVDQWAALPVVHMLAPRDRHWAFFRRALVDGQASGPLATDAQLAALTIENGGVLYTTDRDFARFPGLKWVNPLIGR